MVSFCTKLPPWDAGRQGGGREAEGGEEEVIPNDPT